MQLLSPISMLLPDAFAPLLDYQLLALTVALFFLPILFIATLSVYHRLQRKKGTIAFFHPYCHAGGGGERVLWEAILTIQRQYPHLKCHVYTGDDADGEEILAKAREAFGLEGFLDSVAFIHLGRRHWVEASSWPSFTLLGQSWGSVLLGLEAISYLTPEVFVDTMGYAFTLPLFRVLGGSRTAAYVHYPTISTDMIRAVKSQVPTFNNRPDIAQNKVRTQLKAIYYELFAALYGLMGFWCEVVMVNSAWTEGHIRALWRRAPQLLYPPCDVAPFLELPLQPRRKLILSIAQFRPEKNHHLQLLAMAKLLEDHPEHRADGVQLVMVGGCRNASDVDRLQALQGTARKLGLADVVKVHKDVPFDRKMDLLGQALVGLHTMWNEHFGIGIVEFMAAGAIPLAHHSGGPLLDIVVPAVVPAGEAGDAPVGDAVGFLATTPEEYAAALHRILTLPADEQAAMQRRARAASERFQAAAFADGFAAALQPLCRCRPSDRKWR